MPPVRVRVISWASLLFLSREATLALSWALLALLSAILPRSSKYVLVIMVVATLSTPPSVVVSSSSKYLPTMHPAQLNIRGQLPRIALLRTRVYKGRKGRGGVLSAGPRPFYRDRSLTPLLFFHPTPPLGPFSVRQALLIGQPLGLLRVAVTVVVVDLLLVRLLGHALGVELGRSLHLLAALLYRHHAPRVGDRFYWDHVVLLA